MQTLEQAPAFKQIQEEETYLPPTKSTLKQRLSDRRVRAYYGGVWLRRLAALRPEQPLDVLDAGCGAGDFLYALLSERSDVRATGVDLNRKLLNYSNDRLPHLPFSQVSVQELPFESSTFDVVVSNQVVEHLPSPEQFFAEAHRVLKPDGLLMFATPNLDSLAVKVLKDAWHGYRYDHIALKTGSEWRAACTAANFDVLEDGTTTLTGFPLMRRFPLSILNSMPIAMNGFYSWKYGESYMAVAVRR